MGFMKKYFLPAIAGLTITLNQAVAYDGIILVLEAPLLKEPTLSSKVLQTLRKGSKVYVPNEIGDSETLPEFIETFDRAGNRAYIPTRYVKIITGKTNEFRQSINYQGQDPTDYRIEEPIPVTYPFEDNHFVRSSLAFMVGNNTNSPYEYNSAFTEQDYGTEFGGRFSLTKKIVFDQYNRFYFGLISFFGISQNKLEFQNFNVAKESSFVLRMGPWFTYDAYKTSKYLLSVGTGFTFNYQSSKITVSNDLQSEERTFSGLSIAPMTSTSFTIADIFPNTDFISGADLSLYLPHSLKSSNSSETSELFGENNEINSSFKAQVSLFLGIQVKY
jgi:hypothetical protein